MPVVSVAGVSKPNCGVVESKLNVISISSLLREAVEVEDVLAIRDQVIECKVRPHTDVVSAFSRVSGVSRC